jgi:hypothetical protein
MARNRVIYQSEALFAGQLTGVTDAHTSSNIKQLHRVQSANYAFNVSRTDVNQFGELAAIDRVVLDTPTVSLDFSYLLANFANEENMGLKINEFGASFAALTSALSGVLNKTEDERNYFIQTSREGEDAIGDTDRDLAGKKRASTIGIGNAFVTSYSTEASVGGFPTVSVAAEGMNMNFSTGTINVPNPGINRIDGSASATTITLPPVSGAAGESSDSSGILAISALRPGDITIKISENDGSANWTTDNYSLGGATLPDNDGDSTSAANIQSYNIGFDLGRSPIQRLGNRFAFAREVDFPVSVNLSFDAILTDLTDGNLNDLVDCEKSYNVQIDLKGITGSACDSKKTTICRYVLKDMKPDSQSYTSSIGDNKTVTLDFSTQIGGPRQTEVGLFMQGVTPTITTDNTGPTFILSEVTSAGGGGIAGSVSGDMIFAFSEAVTDSAGEDLRSDDFVIRFGTAGAAAGTDTLLTAETDYTVVDNVNDTKFLIRPSVARKTELGQAAITVSGMMAGTPQDILGNSMTATGQDVAGSVSSYLDTISE